MSAQPFDMYGQTGPILQTWRGKQAENDYLEIGPSTLCTSDNNIVVT